MCCGEVKKVGSLEGRKQSRRSSSRRRKTAAHTHARSLVWKKEKEKRVIKSLYSVRPFRSSSVAQVRSSLCIGSWICTVAICVRMYLSVCACVLFLGDAKWSVALCWNESSMCIYWCGGGGVEVEWNVGGRGEQKTMPFCAVCSYMIVTQQQQNRSCGVDINVDTNGWWQCCVQIT